MSKNKVPNPNGKKGGKKHQDLQKKVGEDVEKRGLDVILEYFLRLINGKARFMDVAGLDKVTREEIEFHQVGKQTKKCLPVKRERDVIEEIEKHKNIHVEFHAYNVEEENENDGTSN
jgi:hypothetical protein